MINTWLILMYLPYIMSATPTTGDYQADVLELEFGVEAVVFDILFVGGEATIPTEVLKWEPGQMDPLELQSVFRAGLRFRCFEAGFEHRCDHVVSDVRFQPPPDDFCYDKFYIKFDTRMIQ